MRRRRERVVAEFGRTNWVHPPAWSAGMTAMASGATDTAVPESMMKRVFRVAEIITRSRSSEGLEDNLTNNRPQKQEKREIVYRQTKDQLPYG